MVLKAGCKKPAFRFFQLEYGGYSVSLHISIAIDGPAGAGKSTVAKAVASRLGLLYVDTGAMYRAAAYVTVHSGLNPEDEQEVLTALERHPLTYKKKEDGSLDIYIGDECITPYLRSPEISQVVSQLSVHPAVREKLTATQRQFREHHGVVMDGRDIGTVVMPNADVKVFLTASLEERARRRVGELVASGHVADEETIRESIAERDARDASRDVAPLKPAHDARILDSTGKPIEAMVAQILVWVDEVTHE